MRHGTESHQLVARVLISFPACFLLLLPLGFGFSLSTEHLRGPALPGGVLFLVVFPFCQESKSYPGECCSRGGGFHCVIKAMGTGNLGQEEGDQQKWKVDETGPAAHW